LSYITDFLIVVKSDGKRYIKYYADSIDSIKITAGEPVHENDDSYLEGKGITGGILVSSFQSESDKYIHVGTNNLKEDVRQSGKHCSWYEREYNIDIRSYWIFPVFDNNGAVDSVFRIMNKTSEIEQNTWTYDERATLLAVARWYEQYGKSAIKMLLQKDEFSDVENNKIYGLLDIEWFDKPLFVLIMTHLKSLAHKKIEHHSAGVCFAIVNNDIINRFLSNFTAYPIQSSLLKINDCLEAGSLDKISLLYKAMNPLSSFCLFTSNGYFHGVRKTQLNENSIENIKGISQKREKSIIFLAQGEHKTIRIYKDGSLFADYYLSESDGKWRFRKFIDFEKILDKIDIDDGIVNGVTELIFDLSFNKIGSMIVFSKNRLPAVDSDNSYAEIKEDCYIVREDQVVPYWASIDGALLCSYDGKLNNIGKILKIDKNKEFENKRLEDLINRHQKGSRHRTAAYYTEENKEDCVIVVSENKGISILHNGQDAVWDDSFNDKFVWQGGSDGNQP
jgi:hypothetical protein